MKHPLYFSNGPLDLNWFSATFNKDNAKHCTRRQLLFLIRSYIAENFTQNGDLNKY